MKLLLYLHPSYPIIRFSHSEMYIIIAIHRYYYKSDSPIHELQIYFVELVCT